MTWEIVAGIIALVGLVGTFVAATWRVSRTLATLDATIKDLRTTLDELRRDNKENHKVFYERLDDHERRIFSIEHGNK